MNQPKRPPLKIVGAEENRPPLNLITDLEKKNGKPEQANGSDSSLDGLGVSQDFQTNTNKPIVPTVLLGTAREEAKVKVQERKDRTLKENEAKPKSEQKENGGMGASFMKGLSSFNESLFKIPRYIYDVAAIPQNLIADLTSNPELAANYDTVTKGTINPLGVLDRIGDHYKGDADQYEAKKEKFNEGVFNSLKSGSYKDAGKQVLNNIAESVPSIAGMYMSGGVGSAAKLGAIGKTMVTALPFASGENAQLQGRDDVPEYIKPINSSLKGLAEVVFDQSFGTKAILDNVITSFQNEGREVAVKFTTDFIKGYVTSSIKKIQPLTSLVKNAIEEMSTQLSQNIIDKSTINPDKDLLEGVADAGIVGGVMGGAISSVGAIAVSSKQKVKLQQAINRRNDIVTDLDNTTIPDEVREDLLDRLERENDKIAKISDDSESVLNSLPDAEKKEATDIQNKIEVLEQTLGTDVSESTKEHITDQIEKEQDKLDVLHETASIINERDAVDTEEKITKEAQAAEKKFQDGGDQVEYEQKMSELDKRAQVLTEVNTKLSEIADSVPQETQTPQVEQAPIVDTPIKRSTDVAVGDKIKDIIGKEGIISGINGSKVTIEFDKGGTLEADPAFVELFKPAEPIITPQGDVTQEINQPAEQVISQDGEVQKPIAEVPIEPVAENTQPIAEQPIEVKEAEVKRKRATVQKILNANYSAEFKSAITEDQIYYNALPKSVTESESNAIVDYLGRERASKEILDLNNGMNTPNRFAIAQKVMDSYEAEGDYDSAIEVLEDLSKRITDTAQGLQSLANFPKLSKPAQVRYAQKEIGRQRDTFKKKHKPKTDKLNKDLKKANAEAAKETVENVLPKLEEVDKVKPKNVDRPAGYGAKNKLVTRDKYLKAKKELRGKFFTGVPTELATIAAYHIEANSRDFAKFSRNMVVDLGNKVKPYLKELYNKAKAELIANAEYQEADFLTEAEVDTEVRVLEGQDWKERLENHLAKGDKNGADVALAKLQEQSKEEGLWGRYKKQAVSKLKGTNVANTQADTDTNPPLREFIDGLVRNMQAKLNESLPEKTKAQRAPVRPAIEVLGDAYKNFEKYQDVWEATQKAFVEKYAEEPDVLDIIDAHFGEILDTPFSQKYVAKSVTEGLNEMGVTGASVGNSVTPKPKRENTISLSQLVLEHYTVVDNTKRKLVDKLIDEAGLEGKEAQELADAVETEFDRVATIKKQKALEAIFSKKERKKPAIKTLEGELIKLTNLGAFREDALVEAYGEKMGFPKLTEENIKEIERLSDIVQKTPESPRKRRAVEDLLAYQAGIKGVSFTDLATAIWYSNMLSGVWTQAVNIVANASNVALLYGNVIAQNPKSGLFAARGLVEGMRRGLLEGKETLLTGYSPIKGKAEVPSLLERYKFEGFAKPLNALKFVRRTMVAADVFFFEGLKEMRTYQLAYKMALEEGKLEPTLDQRNRAIEIIGKSDGQLEAIKERSELELDKEKAEINALQITDTQKKNLIKQAESDNQRRIFDLIEQQRGDLIEETAHYAAKGTYNYPPKGALGAMASMINQMVENVPQFRFVVPFTNIIANVANESIDYTPFGFTRLKKGGYTNFRREALSAQERLDLKTKAIIGTTLTVAVAILAMGGDDDDPILEITANGTGDYRKNEVLKETGWQQYSFRVKNMDGTYGAWTSYQYSPLLPTLAFVGNYKDLTKYKEDTDEAIHTKLGKSAGMTVSSFFQATYLQGLEQFLSSIIDQRSSDKFTDKVTRTVTGAVKGLVLPNLYTQIAKIFESMHNIPLKEVRGTIGGSILQDIPYARDAYYNKVNILGDPLSPDVDKFFSNNKADKYIQLIVDKNAVWSPMSPKTEKIYDIVTQKERALTDKEFFDYSTSKGKFIKKILEANYDAFSKMDDKTFKKQLTKVKTRATKVARYEMMKLNPPE